MALDGTAIVVSHESDRRVFVLAVPTERFFLGDDHDCSSRRREERRGRVGTSLERNAFIHAGSLAFYTRFSMAPVIIITVSITGAVFGREAARGEIVGQLGEVVGRGPAEAVEQAVARSRPEEAGLVPTLMGRLAVGLGKTTVFAQMQISRNRIWGVVARPRRRSLLILVKNRVLSLAVILIIGFILLVSLLVNVALRAAIARKPCLREVVDGKSTTPCPRTNTVFPG